MKSKRKCKIYLYTYSLFLRNGATVPTKTVSFSSMIKQAMNYNEYRNKYVHYKTFLTYIYIRGPFKSNQDLNGSVKVNENV